MAVTATASKEAREAETLHDLLAEAVVKAAFQACTTTTFPKVIKEPEVVQTRTKADVPPFQTRVSTSERNDLNFLCTEEAFDTAVADVADATQMLSSLVAFTVYVIAEQEL